MEQQEKFRSHNIGDILLGTLVVDKDKKIVKVKSIELDSSEKSKHKIGVFYFGKINAEAAELFEECPITIPLLQKLGWNFEKFKVVDLITAYPNKDQWEEDFSEAPLFFPVHFKTRKVSWGNEIEDIFIPKKAKEDEKNWISISSMFELEVHFLAAYGQRMYLDIPDGEFLVSDFAHEKWAV